MSGKSIRILGIVLPVVAAGVWFPQLPTLLEGDPPPERLEVSNIPMPGMELEPGMEPRAERPAPVAAAPSPREPELPLPGAEEPSFPGPEAPRVRVGDIPEPPPIPGGEAALTSTAPFGGELGEEPGGVMPGAEGELPMPGAEEAAESDLPDPEQLLDEIDGAWEELESFGGTRQRVDLDALIEAFHAAELGDAAGARQGAEELGGEPEVFQPSTTTPIESPVASRPVDALHEFAAANPLTAILHDGEQPIARIGHRLVRRGTRLPGGIAVGEIGRRQVLLVGGERRLVLELTPFVARARAANDGEGSGAEDGEEGSGEDELPDAPPAPPQLAPEALIEAVSEALGNQNAALEAAGG